MIERRFMKGAEVRATKKDDKPGIAGYAAVFGQEYVLYEDTGMRIVETIKEGAFTRALKEDQDVRCLFNHAPDHVLGRTTNQTLRLAQDKQGLAYDNDLDIRTHIAQDVHSFVDRKDVTGCSFAFDVRKQVWREENTGKMITYTREIEEIGTLYDVGPVTYPAYDDTTVDARALSLAIPAEIRSRIPFLRADSVARGKKKDEAAECNCRCVACARDGKCDNCADHMVDCGDEENCRCMDKRNAASAGESFEAERARLLAGIDTRIRAAV